MRRVIRLLAFVLAAAVLAVAHAQSEPPAFKPEEIEALVAPIALYPDSLLSQVLMAATYPLEVVQAARWVKANPSVKGDAAVKAVESQPWDVSVKSLVAFPQILEPMNEKIEWTQKLGDAFLADQKGVLAAVQRLRQRAEKSGNLKSSEQQNVTVEQAAPQQAVIQIEPSNPQVIYVPAYNPTIVYGTWAYPAYPPYYWPPPAYYYPGGYLGAGLAFGLGVAAVGAIFSDCDWRHGDVNVNVNKAATIDRNFDRTKVSREGRWQHNASHRGGVAYRDAASRQQFAKQVPGADARRDFRGHGAADRATTSAFQGVGGGTGAQRDLDRGLASSQSMASRGDASAGAGRSSGFASGARVGGGARGGGGRR